MSNEKKYITVGGLIKWLLVIAVAIVLFFFFKGEYEYRNKLVYKNIVYEQKVDSLQKILNEKLKETERFKEQEKLYEAQIISLLNHIKSVERERDKNKIKYDEDKKNIQDMSNNAIVIYVRDQIKLWSE